jgi:SAM-dependent methyltransferase
MEGMAVTVPGAVDKTRRWTEVLGRLGGMIPAPAAYVVVDGPGDDAATFADRLTATLRAAGRRCTRLTAGGSRVAVDGAAALVVADGPGWRDSPPAPAWDVVIWLRSGARPEGEDGADIVVDVHDPGWPVIRHVVNRLAGPGRWYVPENRAFFGIRAANWDTKFGEDLPAYARAVAEADLSRGGVVVDAGCGTGRALPALRAATGDGGLVVGVDFTPQMLDVARAHGRAEYATLLLADARALPFPAGSVDAVFAAGLVMHLPDPVAGLAELARVTRPGGRLALFHPSGRAALAARRGHVLRPDEPLAEGPLRESTRRTGWRLDAYDDPPDRFLALATRAGK